MEATPGAVKQLETYRQALARKHRKLTGDAEKVAASLAGITITLTAKAGEGGRLYGSITSADIAEALLERHQIEVDKRKIELADHIKTVGTYEARVRLHKGVDAALTVEVVAIDQPAEAAPAVEPAPEPAAAPLAEA
jgi:large subunit ribosomal protein L9